MRRRFALLLVSGLLAFTLAGCGGDDKDTGTQDGTGDMVTDENNDALLATIMRTATRTTVPAIRAMTIRRIPMVTASWTTWTMA